MICKNASFCIVNLLSGIVVKNGFWEAFSRITAVDIAEHVANKALHCMVLVLRWQRACAVFTSVGWCLTAPTLQKLCMLTSPLCAACKRAAHLLLVRCVVSCAAESTCTCAAAVSFLFNYIFFIPLMAIWLQDVACRHLLGISQCFFFFFNIHSFIARFSGTCFFALGS